MGILAKYKKEGTEGFKNFVLNLTNSDRTSQTAILLSANLEDPVYSRWIEQNIVTLIPFIFRFNSEQMTHVLDRLTNPTKTLAYAFYCSPEEDQFIKELLPEKYKNKYLEEVEFLSDMTRELHTLARRQILVEIRKLQEQRAIPTFDWKLPTDEVLYGNHFKPPSKGPFQLQYENKQLALQGSYEKKLREGQWKFFYSSGTPMAQGIYLSDAKHGDWIFYDSLGKMQSSGQFRDDSKIGEWMYVNKDGIQDLINHDKT